jgi:uncharacterized membrane protein (DUF485 family)
MDGADDRSRLLDDPEFRALAGAKDRISAILTAATLVVYFGFILLIAFQRDLFGRKAIGNVTVGILLGIGVIVASFVLTGIYVRWANSKYDAMIDTVRRKAGHGA